MRTREREAGPHAGGAHRANREHRAYGEHTENAQPMRAYATVVLPTRCSALPPKSAVNLESSRKRETHKTKFFLPRTTIRPKKREGDAPIVATKGPEGGASFGYIGYKTKLE